MPLYIVGGFVRDLILESPSLDYDLVVEGDAVELANRLVQKYEGRLHTHERFGTAKWHLDVVKIDDVKNDQLPPYLDLITARTEFYTFPTALPTIERGSIKLDLHRRDFTINTLAIRMDGRHYGQLHDYWGGLNDIRKKIVRVLHSLSFVDDPTRMLRAVRFEQRFGFKIDKRTLELLLEAKPLMSRVAGDRVRHELDRIISEIRCSKMMDRLESLGILSTIHPALYWDDWHRARFRSLPSTPPIKNWARILRKKVLNKQEWLKQRNFAWYCLWMIRFNIETIESICDRLHFPRIDSDMIKQGSELYKIRNDFLLFKPSQIVEKLDDISPLAILVTFLASNETGVRDILRKYLEEWFYVTPNINGNDLLDRGLPPGPAYKKILTDLRSAWLDEEISTPKEELDLLDRLIEQAKFSPNQND
jgi:tRNA nucleotidyltransferase (CCA-adding enzyme)